jgi:hypothetical protein
MNAKDRIADFESRIKHDPGALKVISGAGRYFPVNPMADETELLLSLGILPSACVKVDLYWEYDKDIRFVQIQCESYSVKKVAGFYACKGPSGYVDFIVVVSEAFISSCIVNNTLERIVRLEPISPLSNALQRIA